MKKLCRHYLPAFVLLIISFSSFALDMAVGVKGGLNLSSIYGDDKEDIGFGDDKVLPRMAIGANVSLGFSEVFALQPEMLFSMKGRKYESDMLLKVTTKVKYNYLEIPVLAKLSVPVGAIKPFFYAGPSLGILLAAKATIEADGEKETTDLKSNSKNVDFGVAFGGGVDIPAGPGSIVIDARYAIGFIPIYDSEPEMDVKSKTFSILTGYSFSF